MRTKLAALSVLIIVVATIGGIKSFPSKRQQLQAEQKGTLNWHSKRAKERGEHKVVVPTPIINYAQLGGLDEALTAYTVMVAQPVEKISYAQDSYNLITWYKFKVLEKLSESYSDCSVCSSLGDVPLDLLPLDTDEILIPRAGGSLIIDGVEVVNENRSFPPFSMSQNYLLFIALDSSRNIGQIKAGPLGVFMIQPNGLIDAVDKRPYILKEELEARYGRSLKRLKEGIKGRTASH